MEAIGLFQLENLILARSPFTFLDLRPEGGQLPPEPIARCLQMARRVKPEDVHEHLRGADKERPVLLVSEDGKTSVKVARDLEAAGFANVYIIAGGVEGLVSEP